MERIFVLGAGSMAESFIKGVLNHPRIVPENIFVLNRNRPERLQALAKEYGITPALSVEMAQTADVVIVSVKPYDMHEALKQLSPYLQGQTLISFAAGIPVAYMESIIERRATVIRTMPNVPVAVGQGAIAMSSGVDVTSAHRDEAKELLSQLGTVIELDESMMDAATAFSGSGPGFVSYFLEAMEEAAVGLGFSAELARGLLVQTVLGTAKVLEEWKLSPEELRKRVTSPNGTTHAGLTVLADAGMRDAIRAALVAAKERSTEMGDEYTKDL